MKIQTCLEKLLNIQRRAKIKILKLDIETAPIRAYVWGLWDVNIATNQIVEPGYTLCWAAQWQGSEEIFYSSVYVDGTKKMLKKIHKLLDEADAVVHYNGTRFDIPTLNQEFVVNGLNPPSPYKQIDLLKTARKQFKLPSNKLDYVAQHLGIKGKLKHKGMALWRGCLDGDEESWREMQEYNIQDIIVLGNVYDKLRPWVVGHPNHNLYSDSDERICPNCGGNHLHSRGTSKTATMIYRRFQCQDCGSWSRERTNATPVEKRSNILVPDRG